MNVSRPIHEVESQVRDICCMQTCNNPFDSLLREAQAEDFKNWRAT